MMDAIAPPASCEVAVDVCSVGVESGAVESSEPVGTVLSMLLWLDVCTALPDSATAEPYDAGAAALDVALFVPPDVWYGVGAVCVGPAVCEGCVFDIVELGEAGVVL